MHFGPMNRIEVGVAIGIGVEKDLFDSDPDSDADPDLSEVDKQASFLPITPYGLRMFDLGPTDVKEKYTWSQLRMLLREKPKSR